MKWGVFDLRDDSGIIHVVPCSDAGIVMYPHKLEARCPCHPDLDTEVDTLLIHAMVQ